MQSNAFSENPDLDVCLLMGTSAQSGTVHALFVQPGKSAVFGQIAERLSLQTIEAKPVFDGDQIRAHKKQSKMPQ